MGVMTSLAGPDGAGEYRVRLVVSDAPIPGPGEVLVDVAASGVNRADLMQLAGRYPPPPGESLIPGMEVSGIRLDTGEKICALLAGGGHAELVSVPEGQMFPAPPPLPLVDAAAIPEAWLTAFVNLAGEAALRRGETLLVHAGASGVGLAAIALGKHMGARVVATTRTRVKIPALEAAGADLAIDSSDGDPADAVEKQWGPGAVDVILDPVGGKTLAGDLRMLSTGGRIVFLATLSGARAELDLGALIGKRARLIGSTLRARPREEKARIVRRFREEVLPAFDSGALFVSIDSTYPPEEAAAAFTRMRENLNVGKILIDWTKLRRA
jgi:putative PIG3 family NAD(P)H quinone oxidoreductase